MHDKQTGCAPLSKVVWLLITAIIVISLPLSLAACASTEMPQKPLAQKKFSKFNAVFSTTKAKFAKDVPVPLKLEVKNKTAEPARFRWTSAKTHDFTVKDAGGAVVWRWSADKFFAQALLTKTVGPGAKMIFKADWDQRVDMRKTAPAGIYKAEAEFEANDDSFKIGPVRFEILESRGSRQ